MAKLGEVGDSPSPVMTFQIGSDWLAVRVEQVDRVAMAPRLWPVPLATPEHLGLFDAGAELVPVMSLDPERPRGGEQMLAILHVRGESVGLAIDKAGRIYDRYRRHDARTAPPPTAFRAARPTRVVATDGAFWLVDADQLFAEPSDTPSTH
jgi:chemotaxis signal transduction protein